jgi:hypothetical protein
MHQCTHIKKKKEKTKRKSRYNASVFAAAAQTTSRQHLKS